MAMEKQIAAKSRQCKEEYGPNTVAGRLKSSRNALRHGLSLPLRLDTESYEKADAIARALTRDQTDQQQGLAATELAQAQIELLRIRTVRAELMAALDLASGDVEACGVLRVLNDLGCLRAGVVDDVKPKTFLDWIDVHDQVNKLWEEQRKSGIRLFGWGCGTLIKPSAA